MNEEAVLLPNGHVSVNEEEMSMQDWLRRVTGWKSVETYKFAIHRETGKALSQIRREYMDENLKPALIRKNMSVTASREQSVQSRENDGTDDDQTE